MHPNISSFELTSDEQGKFALDRVLCIFGVTCMATLLTRLSPVLQHVFAY